MAKKLIKKQYVAKVDTDSEERTVTAVISSAAIDRDQEILVPRGADLTNFLKNPVVLWAHDHSMPAIGKALFIAVKGRKIVAKVKFASTEFASEIFTLFKEGVLNAFSVGFKPTKSHTPTPKEIAKNPELAEVFRIFDEWELLEFSPVNVPANPEALATAVKSMSDDTKRILGVKVDEIEDDEDEWDGQDEPIISAGFISDKAGGDQVLKVAEYIEKTDTILLDGNYAVTVADGFIEVTKIADQPAIEVKEIPIVVSELKAEPLEIKVLPVQITVTPFIDVQAEIDESIKEIKGELY